MANDNKQETATLDPVEDETRPVSVTVRFDEETSALIRRALGIFKRRHQDMNPTQLARDGTRRWAAEVIASEGATVPGAAA